MLSLQRRTTCSSPHVAALLLVLSIATTATAGAQPAALSPKARAILVEVREIIVNQPREQRRQLTNNLISHYLNRADLDNAIELAVHLDGDQSVFSSIASHQIERGDLKGALRTAALPSDSTDRAAVITSLVGRLSSLRRFDDALAVAATIPSPLRRGQALASASRYMYPRDSSVAPLLRSALALAWEDTSARSASLRQTLTQQLMEVGDWSGVARLEASITDPRQRVQFLASTAQTLRTKGDRRADSLYRLALGVVNARQRNDPVRLQLLSTYINSYSAGPADSNYMAIAAEFDEQNTRAAYLARVANMYVQQRDTVRPLHIVSHLLSAGDTVTAARLLMESAQTLAQGRYNDGLVERQAAASMLDHLMKLTQSSTGPQHQQYAENARSLMVTVNFDKVRVIVRDSGISILKDWTQENYVRTLQAFDVREAIAVARQIPDSSRRDRLLSEFSQRQMSAGYVAEAMETIGLIRTPLAKLQGRLQLVNHRMQYGDTTDVRATIREVFLLEQAQPSAGFQWWQLPYVVVRAGMVDEVLALSRSLPDMVRAQMLLALVGQLRS